jgi:hypothetical protein
MHPNDRVLPADQAKDNQCVKDDPMVGSVAAVQFQIRVQADGDV